MDNTSHNIAAEQTRLLYVNALMPIVVSVCAAALMVLILWPKVDNRLLLGWLAALTLISGHRLRILLLYNRQGPGDQANQDYWHFRFLIGTYISALIWGISAFTIFPEHSLSYQIVYFMVLAGMAAGGISSLCPSFKVVAGFLSLILFPLILKQLLYLTLPSLLQACLVFLFWYVTVSGSKKINLNIRENIELRHQSINREKILKISEERYRHIFSNAPLGIMQYDDNGIIIDCNEELVRILGSARERLIGMNMLTSLENRELLEALRKSITSGEGYFEGDYISGTGNKTTPIRVFFKTIQHSEQGVSGGICIVEDFTEKRETEQLIKYHASYDTLTGLPNRRLFLDHLEGEISRAERHNYFGALLYLDIDNFKTINDSLGHSVGDEFLIMIASRLSEFIRKEDVAARMGGDEFTVVFTALANSSQLAASKVKKIAEELSLCLSSACKIGKRDLQSTVSIGISLFPKESRGVDDILKQADTALYRAKAAGRNEIRFFLPSMQEAADEKLQLSTELRYALKQDNLYLCYQPQTDISGNLVGAEALLRWRHPQKGLIPPSVFINIAEETGLMQDIGQWVLQTACRRIKEWKDTGLLREEQTISVNISGMEIASPGFAEQVKRVLVETGAHPHYLGIELTEGSLVSTGSDIVGKMKRLRELGVRFSVDDFGTGYSSLNYLKSLPLHTLKIDRSFVNDINSTENNVVLVDTIIMMARNLGIEVIAEGVETEQELHYLYRQGCFIYQGFYFSKPLEEEPFVEVLRRGSIKSNHLSPETQAAVEI
ncbi:MAG: EAL domain-containing protein [Desulfofustis sp.]|nr:EAL domain-containing protein [Desulfofustis sp.]